MGKQTNQRYYAKFTLYVETYSRTWTPEQMQRDLDELKRRFQDVRMPVNLRGRTVGILDCLDAPHVFLEKVVGGKMKKVTWCFRLGRWYRKLRYEEYPIWTTVYPTWKKRRDWLVDQIRRHL